MIGTEVMVWDEVGLHARTATIFAKKAMLFESQIKIEGNNKVVNGKSMLSLMSLGIKQGMKIKITADGVDEKMAINSLTNLVENNFKN